MIAYRYLCSALSLGFCSLFLTAPVAANCAVSNTVSLPPGTDSILVGGALGSESSQAVNKWTAACPGSGSTFPALQSSGSADITLTVKFYDKQRDDDEPGFNGCESTSVQGINGVMTGATIEIWSLRRDGAACNASRKDLIAHGIGHSLGLTDALDPSCNGTIMGRPIPGEEMQMVPEVCNMVQDRWTTSTEIQSGGTSDGPLDDDTGSSLDCGALDDCGSPIVIDLNGDNFEFTGIEDGVLFDLDHDGQQDWVSWTAASTDDAFLVLDRNGNGRVDGGRELFGNFTPQPRSDEPNGFIALSVFDLPIAGGNGDGLISRADEIFAALELWHDRNHDGWSQPEELTPLEDSQITAIELENVSAFRRDRHGNLLRWLSWVHFDRQRRLSAVDVIFEMSP